MTPDDILLDSQLFLYEEQAYNIIPLTFIFPNSIQQQVESAEKEEKRIKPTLVKVDKKICRKKEEKNEKEPQEEEEEEKEKREKWQTQSHANDHTRQLQRMCSKSPGEDTALLLQQRPGPCDADQ
ncbi:hypothetical protein STEG23_015804 [Scotinomys teguina]